jgi:hypothetical protein
VFERSVGGIVIGSSGGIVSADLLTILQVLLVLIRW